MLCSFSALDAWFGLRQAPVQFIYHQGDLASLAKVSDLLAFPGLPYADAIEDSASGPGTGQSSGQRYVCSDGSCLPLHPVLRLKHDPAGRYYDARHGIYEFLLAAQAGAPGGSQGGNLGGSGLETGDSTPEQIIFETAILTARYPLSLDEQPAIAAAGALPERLPGQYQQDLLLLLLDSTHPERGFEVLRHCGFLERYWPELADLATVDHAKDFHPEGDAWRHTMETFSHRKTNDLVLSLGLLLHDIGKPDASANAGRRFDGHADIGGQQALRFLRRLGFPERLAQDVFFLVRYHMMPAALPVLPVYRVEEQLRHPLFPVLLELYRCDELSTFRGPDGYYAACAAYRDWCRHTKNPYRLAVGRKRQDKNPA